MKYVEVRSQTRSMMQWGFHKWSANMGQASIQALKSVGSDLRQALIYVYRTQTSSWKSLSNNNDSIFKKRFMLVSAAHLCKVPSSNNDVNKDPCSMVVLACKYNIMEQRALHCGH